MITPNEDKIAIKAILDTDGYINRAGFLPENIKTVRYGTEVLNQVNNDLQIFIYLGTPENPGTFNQRGVVFRIALVGRSAKAPTIDLVMSQIIALLSETDIGRSHILYLLDPPLQLESDPSIYFVEVSFICYETIYNKVKK